MRVLITNMRLARRSGTEVVAQLTAEGLRRAGHEPVVYAPLLGDQAEAMKAQGHRVVDRLSALPFRPDVIHAQHVTPALMAMTAFPETPVVHVCHSARFLIEQPLVHPQVRRHVAVDALCRERCRAAGAPEDRLSVIYNPVDLETFLPRRALPPRPRRALMLTKTHEQKAAVRAACQARDIELIELGPAAGRISARLEQDLHAADLVFATARMAIEAAAVGCAVVVADGRGVAGLLTAERWPEWRRHNLGAALLTRPVSADALSEAIDAYDPADAQAVREAVRRDADLKDYTQAMLALYGQAIDDARAAPAADTALHTARLLEDWLPSPAERPWREMAGEMGWASRWNAELQDVEIRIGEAVAAEGRKTRRAIDRGSSQGQRPNTSTS